MVVPLQSLANWYETGHGMVEWGLQCICLSARELCARLRYLASDAHLVCWWLMQRIGLKNGHSQPILGIVAAAGQLRYFPGFEEITPTGWPENNGCCNHGLRPVLVRSSTSHRKLRFLDRESSIPSAGDFVTSRVTMSHSQGYAVANLRFAPLSRVRVNAAKAATQGMYAHMRCFQHLAICDPWIHFIDKSGRLSMGVCTVNCANPMERNQPHVYARLERNL